MHHPNVFPLVNLDSVVKVNKKYYPPTLLEELKYEMKKNKMENLINDDFDSSSSDESDNESDNQSKKSESESHDLFVDN